MCCTRRPESESACLEPEPVMLPTVCTQWTCSQIFITVIAHCYAASQSQVPFCLPSLLLRELRRRTCAWSFSSLPAECQRWLSQQSLGEPKQGCLQVEATLHAEVVVLYFVLAHDHRALLSFDDTILAIYLVANDYGGDVPGHFPQVLKPRLDTKKTVSFGHVKEDQCAVGTYEIAISETSKLFSSCRVPNLKNDIAGCCRDTKFAHLTALCGLVHLQKLSSEMSFHKCCLPNRSISQKNELEVLLPNSTRRRR
mmetsp:Transcript_90059/g.160371  ORF Transcript_90059/g.160371 Transcript_90059/m.160371 type:complete len:254 (-) Transcript_90059:119-880(-)